jgi:hypothetical protein
LLIEGCSNANYVNICSEDIVKETVGISFSQISPSKMLFISFPSLEHGGIQVVLE